MAGIVTKPSSNEQPEFSSQPTCMEQNSDSAVPEPDLEAPKVQGDPLENMIEELMKAHRLNPANTDGLLAKYVLDKVGAVHTEKDGEVIEQEDAMWDKLVAGGYHFPANGGSGNPMAGRWARYLESHPEEKAKYKGSRKVKADMRAAWCEEEHKAYTESKVHLESLTRKKGERSRLFSVHRIAVEEGGGEAGMRAAINYCLWCVQEPMTETGDPRVEYCHRTKVAKFDYAIKESAGKAL